MQRIGVRELRQHASRYLASVKQGETVEVTERGQLVALLTPPTPAMAARDRLVASGRVVPAASSRSPGGVTSWPSPIDAEGPSNAQLLEDSRPDRL